MHALDSNQIIAAASLVSTLGIKFVRRPPGA